MGNKGHTSLTGKAELEKFCRLAEKLGAKKARIISTRNVFTAAWVRKKCQFGCDGYARCLTCPPFSPLPEKTRKVLDDYHTAILIHCDDRSREIKEIVVQLEREVFLSGYYKALGFGAGPCNLCSDCNLKRCRYPDRARPSMEAAGIDVFKTARKAGFPIEVLNSFKCQPNYYGLVLIE